MSAHTPGPWFVAEVDPDGFIDRCIMGGAFYVATVHDASCSDDIWAADARLIAAAPQLLAALQMALANVEMPTGIGLGFGGLEFRFPPWAEAARIAISKATGIPS